MDLCHIQHYWNLFKGLPRHLLLPGWLRYICAFEKLYDDVENVACLPVGLFPLNLLHKFTTTLLLQISPVVYNTTSYPAKYIATYVHLCMGGMSGRTYGKLTSHVSRYDYYDQKYDCCCCYYYHDCGYSYLVTTTGREKSNGLSLQT